MSAKGNVRCPIGFWKDARVLDLSPNPDPRDKVDLSWNEAERRIVAEYLEAGQRGPAYFGYSYCRFECGIDDSKMGSADMTDNAYAWPEGYSHYIRVHGVKPPQDFVDYVLSQMR